MSVDAVVAAEAGVSGAAPRIIAALIARTDDWSLAEDCTQEALSRALAQWPVTGVPDNPGGWLMTVARNLAIDALRRRRTAQAALERLAALSLPPEPLPTAGPDDVPDDRLRLIFTCCHPALALEARVALTLRTVCGVPTADIARAMLVTESSMTRRITRAKAKIIDAGIAYRVPSQPEMAERLPGVLAVVYLLFTGGHDPAGDARFAPEALRLARLITTLLDDDEAVALLALILLTHARHPARHDHDGELVALQDQDRTRWDRAMIDEGLDLVDGLDHTGQYVIQARIAAEHARAATWDATDWATIAAHYDELFGLRPDPVVALNRAIATGHGRSAAAGLSLLADIRRDGQLDDHAVLAAAEAHLVHLGGDPHAAAHAFRRAARLATDESTRRALTRRADDIDAELRAMTERHQ